MSDAAMPTLELILRQCAAAAPQPWYPRQFAAQSGVSREVLDPHLDRLRLGGFVQLTEWTQDHGQGYQLTPTGKELLDRPRLLEGVRQGNLPEGRPPEPEPVMQPQVEVEGDAFREVITQAAPFRPRVTFALLCLNVAVFAVGLTLAQHAGMSMGNYFSATGGETFRSVLLQQGAMVAEEMFATGQWWRMLTCAFVHIGILHLVVNMVSLWFVGPVVERLLGPGRYLLFYLLSALGGSFGVMIDTPMSPTAGASGALWGLMGGLAVYVFANRRALPPQIFQAWFRQLIGVILLNALITMQLPGISKGAHFGGGIAGALLVMPVDALRIRRGSRAGIAAVLIVVMTGAGFRYAYQSLEPVAIRSAGVNEFNTSFVNQVEKLDKGSAKLAHDSLSAFENRDPEDVAKLRKFIELLSADMNAIKEQLAKSGPYLAENVEDARQTAITLLTADIALLAKIDRCLQHQNPCNLDAEETAVQKARTHWRSLLK